MKRAIFAPNYRVDTLWMGALLRTNAPGSLIPLRPVRETAVVRVRPSRAQPTMKRHLALVLTVAVNAFE